MKLSSEERDLLKTGVRPPFKVTSHWESLLDGRNDDPLRIQVVPSARERITASGEISDPLGEASHTPLPRLVHRYGDRALVVTTGRCALYCRHCFRRRLTGDDYGEISVEEVGKIASWLKDRSEVKEILLSGGDPLTIEPRKFLKIIDELRGARPGIVIRVATRVPIVDPGRIRSHLLRALGRRRPLWMVIQCNHPRELSPAALKTLERIQRRGIPILNQSVLLRGVNDRLEVLEKLFRDLAAAGVKPYYLFQGDLAEGTSHFRLPLAEARSLVDKLRGRLSGLAMPNFAVDLPGGEGKVPLAPDYVLGHDEKGWRLKSPDNVRGYYPDPEE